MAELVRHFLIEPTPKGVKLKGCSNEPVFGKWNDIHKKIFLTVTYYCSSFLLDSSRLLAAQRSGL